MAALQGINPCGKTTCLELAYAAIFRIGWQAAAVLALLLIAAPNLLLTLLHMCTALGKKEHSDMAVVMAEAGRRTFADSSFCDGAYGAAGNSIVLDLQQQQLTRRWGTQQYSPVVRMRKSVFFNRPLDMDTERHTGESP